jgi:phosphosulfolactate synthase (CoM biosynthesis protein A)
MLIGDKLKVKENFDKLINKIKSVEELRLEIIVSNGGSREDGISAEHENYQKCVSEIQELYSTVVEISIQVIPMNVLERFEVSERVTMEAIEILSGSFVLPEEDQKKEEAPKKKGGGKSVRLKPEPIK